MKPWEETWDTGGDGTIYAAQGSRADVLCESRFPWEQDTNFGAFGDLSGASPFNPTKEDDARAVLAAAAPDMARVLLAIEFGGYDHMNGLPMCPECCEGTRHASTCALDAALRKAGVR